MSTVHRLLTEHIDIWTAADTKKKSGRGRSANDADSVFGIKKLRELILELAVRGKLVPQETNDEPASDLLQRIRAEKAKLIIDGKLKTSKPMPTITKETQPYALPGGWEWTKLGEIVLNIISGGTPRKTHSEFWNGDIPWASVKDLNVTKYLDKTQDYITLEGLEAGSKLAKKGDLLICTRMGLGKIAIAAVDVAINQDLKALKLTSLFDVDYFINFYRTLKIVGSGMTVAGIKQDELLNFCVPTPPLAEQYRIVAKVDELMALCDQLEARHVSAVDAHEKLVSHLLGTLADSHNAEDFDARWQRIAAHFDVLFTTVESIDAIQQIVLQLAMTGKLTRPTQESNIVKTTRIDCHDKAIKNSSASSILPNHWQLKKLDEVAETIVDCPHSTPKWANDGKICVRTNQFRAGKLDLTNSRYVNEATFQERTQRLRPRVDDILYSREGGILGIACRVPPNVDLCMGQRMMLIRANSNIAPAFLEMLLNSPMITSIARERTIGGAAPRINVSTVKAFPIPLPPMEEQLEIVVKICDLTALCDQLKSSITAASQLEQKLADALVEQAVT
jgi:type I restriction enzyme, S subunit